MTVAKRSASFIKHLRFDELSTKVLETVQWALTDYAGVTIGGSDMPAAKKLRDFQNEPYDSPAVRLFGTDNNAGIVEAVLVNGTSSHALDYDDVSWTTIGHPTVTVAPVVFAYGEALGKSGRDIITAYVAGVEVQHKIATALMPEVSDRGWHTTSVFGAVGAAAAAAKINGLNEETTANALGIAASMAGGGTGQFRFSHESCPCRNGLSTRCNCRHMGQSWHYIFRTCI